LALRRSILRALLSSGTLVAALAGGAQAQSPAASSVGPTGSLDNTNWSLTSISASSVASDAGVMLDFVAGAAGGFSGCNHFAVTYTATPTSLAFGPITVTRIVCDDDRMAVEMSFLTALSTVSGYTAAGDTLTLIDATGAAVLTFGGSPMPSVQGSWAVTSFFDGSAATTPTAGSDLTVAFLPDGRVRGNGGCNEFGGPYAVSGNEIAIGPLMSTTTTCGGDIDARELGYLSALEQAAIWAIESGRLELRDFSDTILVGADRAGGP
jgi:heat shock protein HslJ